MISPCLEKKAINKLQVTQNESLRAGVDTIRTRLLSLANRYVTQALANKNTMNADLASEFVEFANEHGLYLATPFNAAL